MTLLVGVTCLLAPLAWSGEVYANYKTVAHKGAGKLVVAFPDVVKSPDTRPATPPGVPVPYPSFGCAPEDKGCQKAKVKAEIKNQKYTEVPREETPPSEELKKIQPRTEAPTYPQKGKYYFAPVSPIGPGELDVKAEAGDALRFLELIERNHK